MDTGGLQRAVTKQVRAVLTEAMCVSSWLRDEEAMYSRKGSSKAVQFWRGVLIPRLCLRRHRATPRVTSKPAAVSGSAQ